MEQTKVSKAGFLAIMSLYLVYLATYAMSPAMGVLAAQFPDKNVNLIATLPALFVIIGSLGTGPLLGKKINVKLLAIVASLLILIAGCVPYFMGNFGLILVFRAILGLGVGILAPLENALIMSNYTGQKQAAVLGYGTVAMNIGGFIMQTLSGALASVSWNTTFLTHLVSIVALVMAFFLPSLHAPEMPPEMAAEGGKPAEKAPVPKIVFVIGLVIFIYYIMTNSVLITTAPLLEMRGLGTAAQAGLALGIFTLIGCVGGIVFGSLLKTVPRWCVPSGLITSGVGTLIMFNAGSYALVIVGLCLLGFGFAVVFAAMLAWTGIVAPPGREGISSSIVISFMNAGTFVSAFWLALLGAAAGNSITANLLVETIVMFVMTVIFLIKSPFVRKKD